MTLPHVLEDREESYDQTANSFGAVYTLGERMRHLLFWKNLRQADKQYVSRIKEDIPFDNMAGLANPGKKLYTRSNVWIPFVFTLSRIALNWAVSGDLFLSGWHKGDFVFGSGYAQESYTELKKEAVVMCEKNLQGRIANKSNLVDINCVKSDLSRLTAFKVISLCEFATLSITNTLVLLACILYLCGCDAVISRTPGVFLIVPKFASKFSSLCFLQFINLSRTRSLFVQGEWRLIVSIIWDTILPCSNQGQKAHLDTMEDFEPRESWLVDQLVAGFFICVKLCACFVTVGLSFQALLVKLTSIHFATVRNFYDWSLYEWVVIAGFLNQIAGLTFVDEIEIHRLMLFKFCGAKAEWSWNHARVCTAYMKLLAMKIGDGWLLEQRFNRFKVLAVLTTIDSPTIQCIFLSREREKKMIQVRETQFELFDVLSCIGTNAVASRVVDDLETKRRTTRRTSAFGYFPLSEGQKDQDDPGHVALDMLKNFKAERDKRFARAKDPSELSSEMLRTIAELQSHIEDLEFTTKVSNVVEPC